MSITGAEELAELERPPVIIVNATMRRLEVADIEQHFWIVARLKAAYPHLDERTIPGWLRTVVYQNDLLALFQEHSVALAQTVRPDPFTPKLVVWERFVFAQDPKNQRHLAEASLFYERFSAWARTQDIQEMVVGVRSDVPGDMIRDRLGKLSQMTNYVARVT